MSTAPSTTEMPRPEPPAGLATVLSTSVSVRSMVVPAPDPNTPDSTFPSMVRPVAENAAPSASPTPQPPVPPVPDNVPARTVSSTSSTVPAPSACIAAALFPSTVHPLAVSVAPYCTDTPRPLSSLLPANVPATRVSTRATVVPVADANTPTSVFPSTVQAVAVSDPPSSTLIPRP